MTDTGSADRYPFEELYELQIDNCYMIDEEFAAMLAKSLCYLSRGDADAILERTFFIPFRGESWHFSENLIAGRAVVIIDSKDLESEDEAIITILHEAGHVYLGHKYVPPHGPPPEERRRREDEAWQQVHDWLPPEFTAAIDRAERLGGGSNGVTT